MTLRSYSTTQMVDPLRRIRHPSDTSGLGPLPPTHTSCTHAIKSAYTLATYQACTAQPLFTGVRDRPDMPGHPIRANGPKRRQWDRNSAGYRWGLGDEGAHHDGRVADGPEQLEHRKSDREVDVHEAAGGPFCAAGRAPATPAAVVQCRRRLQHERSQRSSERLEPAAATRGSSRVRSAAHGQLAPRQCMRHGAQAAFDTKLRGPPFKEHMLCIVGTTCRR